MKYVFIQDAKYVVCEPSDGLVYGHFVSLSAAKGFRDVLMLDSVLMTRKQYVERFGNSYFKS